MNDKRNKYVEVYLNNYIKQFRGYISKKYNIKIGGLADFVTESDGTLSYLLANLQMNGFDVAIERGHETIDEVLVEYSTEEDRKLEWFEYRIENLISIIDISSKSNISIVGIFVMQIVSRIINKTKTLYKAIILDLDDTLWAGTLAEMGLDVIKQNISSNRGSSFLSFSRFISSMAKELGLYVAICSKNDMEIVQNALSELDTKEFPLKDQIDCIVANHCNKSDNIKAIAEKLSILTKACVFVDDNKLVRDEVRKNLPDVFVPEWDSHEGLMTLLEVCCIFERHELSLNSRNRKRQYLFLEGVRKKGYLPTLLIKSSEDPKHIEANRLYSKSNQFKFAEQTKFCSDSQSVIYDIYRDNGENLGICAAITYVEKESIIHVLNWAISCRYFEIGLEEYILNYLYSLARGRDIVFSFDDTGYNGKSISFVEKYRSMFRKFDKKDILQFIPSAETMREIHINTNLIEYRNEKQ